MNPLKFAVVGVGRIGMRHIEQIKKIGILTAVCDVDAGKLKLFEKENTVMLFDSLAQMLTIKPDADVIAICTPNGLHAVQTIDCLNAGFHVICEKPMALSSADCRRMITCAEENNKQLFVVKQNRYNPPVVALRKLIESNSIGKILSVQLNCFWNRNEDYYRDSWKGTRDLDGGTLFTQFSHFIDLLFWLVGDVAEVQAFCANQNHKDSIEFEDTGVIILRFANGALGTVNYTVNAYAKNMEGSITIFGEYGTIKVGGEYLNELEYQMIRNGRLEHIPLGNKPNDYGTYKGSMSNHNLVYQNVINVLAGKEAMTTKACEAMKTVEIIEEIYSVAK